MLPPPSFSDLIFVHRATIPSWRRWYLYPSFILLAASRAAAVASNRTIDDELGDSATNVRPTYTPPDQWSQGASCSVCWIRPDAGQAFDGTWHDSTFLPGNPGKSITVQFTGTAVYVYNIIANTMPDTATLTSMTFQLDGVQAGTYVHPPDPNRSDIQYQVLVFHSVGLSNTDHTLVMQTLGSDASVVLFDYIQYTFDDGIIPQPPPSESTFTATVTSTSTSTSTSTVTTSVPIQPNVGTSSSTTSTSSPTSSPPSSSSSTTKSSSSSSSSAATQFSSPNDPTSTFTSPPDSPPSTITENTQTTVSVGADAAQRRSNLPTTAIVGATLGGVLALAALVLLLCFVRRRRRVRSVSPVLLKEKAAGYDLDHAYAPAAGSNTALVVAAASTGKEDPIFTTPTSETPIHGACAVSRNNEMFSDSEFSLDRLPAAEDMAVQGYGFSNGGLGFGGLHPLRDTLSGVASATEAADRGLRQYRHHGTRSIPAIFAGALPPSRLGDPLTDEDEDRPDQRAEVAIPEPEPGPEHGARSVPVLHISSPPTLTCELPRPSSAADESVLRTQVAVLQEELARIREQQERQGWVQLDEAPPTYDEARTGRAPILL